MLGTVIDGLVDGPDDDGASEVVTMVGLSDGTAMVGVWDGPIDGSVLGVSDSASVGP